MPDHLVISAMQRWGGSFVKALAQACKCADPENLGRIKTAFPEIWAKYSSLARSEAPTTVLE